MDYHIPTEWEGGKGWVAVGEKIILKSYVDLNIFDVFCSVALRN